MTTLLDIGCNVLGGYDCLQRYETITNNTRKIFVEPNPECWSEIEKRITSLPNSTLIKKAISTKQDIVELITRADVNSDIAATIISKEYLEASLAKCNMFVNEFNRYTIESTTIRHILDDYNITPEDTVLKLDIEGMEYCILNDILQHNIIFKRIYCEFHIHSNEDVQKKIELLTRFANTNTQVIDWQ